MGDVKLVSGSGFVTITANNTSKEIEVSIPDDVTKMSNYTTDDLAEGSNKYFTTNRIDSHISAGTGINYNTGVITNTDTGSDAVSSHESNYNHDNYLTTITNQSITNLNDVETPSPSDGEVLRWDNSSGYWKSQNINDAIEDPPIDSVFGRTGAVSAQPDDYSASQITNDSLLSGTYVSNALDNLDTDDVSEGSNLYYTDTRVDNHLSGGTGINYSKGTISTDDSQIDHNNLSNYVAKQHIDWSQSQIENIHPDNYTDTDTTYTSSDFNHDELVNTHNLSSDIDHNNLTNYKSSQHIDWTKSQSSNIHPDNYTDTDTTYESSDFNHDQLQNFEPNEHIDWTVNQDSNIHPDNYTNTTYSAGTGLSLSGTEFQNTDTGSDAVSSHESTYNHDAFLSDITNESLNDLSDVSASSPTDGHALVWNNVDGQWEPKDMAEVDTHTNISEDGTQILSNVDDINFVGSNATSVSVNNDADGSVTVDIYSTDTTYTSSDFDHDELQNFETNEHIDWTIDQSSTYTFNDNNVQKSAITQYNYTQTDLGIDGLLSIDGVSNQDGDVDLVNAGNVTITPDNSNNQISLSVPNDLTVISNYSTDDLSEGINNKYFTTSRIDDHLSGGKNIDYNSGTIDVDITSNIDFKGTYTLNNLAEPSNLQDAATKHYVDAMEKGLDIKDSVRAATDGINVDLTSNLDPNPIDGVTLADGDRVLLKDQSILSENGIYVANTATDPQTWSRSTDADEDSEVTSGMFAFVEEGTTNNNRGFVVSTNDPITVDSTDIEFTQFSGVGQIEAGTGLNKSGDVVSHDPASVHEAGGNIEVNHDNLAGFVSNEHVDHSSISITTSGILSGGGDLTASRDISLNHSDVDHDQTTNFVSNEHIDHSGVTVTGGTGLSGGGDLTSSRTINLDATVGQLNNVSVATPTAAQMLLYDATNAEFVNANLTAGSGISKTEADGSLSISADEANIDHDSLQNFEANEHIDWTIDQGTTNVNDNNIQKSAVTQYTYTQSDLGINGLLSVDGVSNQDGDVDLVNAGNVTITPDNTNNQISFSVPNDLTVISNYDTDDLSEGTGNLYFTTSRVDDHLSGGKNISYSSGTIALDITSDVDFKNSYAITNLVDPSNPQDAATKYYVDSLEQALILKGSVVAATDGQNIDLTSTTDPNPIDGVTLADGDRVLLKDQTDATQNGIYDAVTATDPSSWIRSADADDDADVTAGMFTFVEEGTSNNNKGFVLITNDPVTVGTTELNFTQFSGAGQITAGTGLNKSGDTINHNSASVHEAGGAVEINHDNLAGFLVNEHIDWTVDQGTTASIDDGNIEKTAITQYAFNYADLSLGIDDTPVNGETAQPISSNWAYDHTNAATGVHGAGSETLLHTGSTLDCGSF